MPRKRRRVTLTEKIQAAYLRQALSRRRANAGRTHLYDHSLPQDLRFHGLLHGGRPAEPQVRVGPPEEFSPFVVHLSHGFSPPTPQEWLEEGAGSRVYVNFLLPESRLLALAQPDDGDGLALSAEDLLGQLGSARAPRDARLPRPALPRPDIRLPDARAAFANPVALAAFAPPKPPDDLDRYFDLPETEREPATARSAAPARPARTGVPKAPGFAFGLPAGRPAGWHRALGAFVLLSFVFVLPLHAMNLVSELREAKSDLFSSGEAALSAFEAGTNAALVRDSRGASAAFQSAGGHFADASGSLKRFGAVATLIGGTDLVEAGESLARAGKRLADGFAAMETEIDPTPVSRLRLLETYVASALPHLKEAEARIAGVDADALGDGKGERLAELRQGLPVVTRTLEEFLEFSDMLATVLGDDGTKRYLLVFQNNTELRPTGGFMGSFAELAVNDGEIVNLEVPGGGTYDLQGSLRTDLVAPEPLRLLKARWEFQDANWFADFPTSARKILEFYADAGGGTADGVIAVNATYVADLIGLLGPFDMPGYDRTITGENFVFEAQKIVELEYDKEENAPKAFIGDLAPLLLDRAIERTGEDFLSVLDETNRGLSERHIQLYFTDDTLQREVLDLGWGGEIKWTDGDYLMVVDTNLGGGKTDGVIEQDVKVTVRIGEDGSVTNEVEVTRTHFGIAQALFTGVNNVDYLRLYVPKGSELLHAEGFSIPDASLFEEPEADWRMDDDLFYSEQSKVVDPGSGTEVYEESGKTVFGNWVQTRPGESSTARFVYRLPFTLGEGRGDEGLFARLKSAIGIPSTETYALTLQKQSGVPDRRTTVELQVPESLRTLWSSHELEGAAFDNRHDGFFAVLFETE